MKDPYGDIIHLTPPEPKNRQRMSMIDRAAQFSPFAALTGFEAAIREEGRLTDRAVELAQDGVELLDGKLRNLAEQLEAHPEVTVCCFEPDVRKNGGSYVTVIGRVKELDRLNGMLVLTDGRTVSFGRILDITKNEDC